MPPRRDLGTVLVTGARGFLGAAAVRRLRQEGKTVLEADLADPASPELLPCDVTRPEEVAAAMAGARIDTVLHCGAVSGPMVLADQPAAIWAINAQGTAHVLEAARQSGVGRVVVCSTTEVYGREAHTIPDEAALPNPPTVYGASKVAAEQAVLGYAREHGLDAIAIRLSWIYGPGRKTPTTLETLLRAGLDGRAVRLDAHPDDITHYLYIEDAVAGLLAAASAERPSNRIFNVTAGQGRAMGRILEDLRKALPTLRAELAAERPSGEGPAGFGTTRAKAEIGYTPRIAFPDGIARYLRALQDATGR